MKLIPYHRYQIASPLALEEIVGRLQLNVEPKKFIRLIVLPDLFNIKPYEGTYSEKGFSVIRVSTRKNPKPTIIGSFSTPKDRNIIDMEMKPSPLSFIPFLFMMAFVIIFCVAVSVNMILASQFQPFILIPLPVVFLIYWFQTHLFNYECVTSKIFFADLFEGTEL